MGQTDVKQSTLKYKGFTAILFWAAMAVLCSLYMTIPLLTVFEARFAISSSQAAWAGSIFSLFFALGCLFFGIVSEKYGLKRVMVIGLMILSVLTLFIGMASSFQQLLLFRALQGLTCATFSPVVLTYVGTTFPVQHRVGTIGMISFGFLMAGIMGQLMSSLIEPFMGWRAVFYFFAAVYFMTAFLMMMLPKDKSDQDQKILTVVKKLALPFRNKIIILTYCIALTILLTFVGMYTALGIYLAENFGFTFEQVFYVRAAGIVGIVLSPLAGFFIQRFGTARVLNTSLLVSAAALFLMGMSNVLSLIIIMSVVFVAGIATVVPTLIAFVAHLGGANKGIVTSVYVFILFLGASLGPILATAILQLNVVSLPFLIFGAVLAGALLLAIYIGNVNAKRHRQKNSLTI